MPPPPPHRGKETPPVIANAQTLPASRLNTRPVTLAVIVGNRDFFPGHLANSGRQTILEVLEKAGINAIITPENDTNVGGPSFESCQHSSHGFSYLPLCILDLIGIDDAGDRQPAPHETQLKHCLTNGSSFLVG